MNHRHSCDGNKISMEGTLLKTYTVVQKYITTTDVFALTIFRETKKLREMKPDTAAMK